jgi:hypothetical protein
MLWTFVALRAQTLRLPWLAAIAEYDGCRVGQLVALQGWQLMAWYGMVWLPA